MPDFQAQFREETVLEEVREYLLANANRLPMYLVRDTAVNQKIAVFPTLPTGSGRVLFTVHEVDGPQERGEASMQDPRFQVLPLGSYTLKNPAHIAVPGDHPAFRALRARPRQLRIQ